MSSLAVWPAPVRDQNFYGKQFYDVNLHFSFLTLTHCTGPLCPCKVRRHVIVLMSHCLTRASLKIHLVQSKRYQRNFHEQVDSHADEKFITYHPSPKKNVNPRQSDSYNEHVRLTLPQKGNDHPRHRGSYMDHHELG
jgi:hypothetical protein